MVLHLVLFSPRPDLDEAGVDALVSAFLRAAREIPTVRGVRIGRRARLGASYETDAPGTADYLAQIEFDSEEDLAAYLRHPSHADLGVEFGRALASAAVYDFVVTGIEGIDALRRWPRS